MSSHIKHGFVLKANSRFVAYSGIGERRMTTKPDHAEFFYDEVIANFIREMVRQEYNWCVHIQPASRVTITRTTFEGRYVRHKTNQSTKDKAAAAIARGRRIR